MEHEFSTPFVVSSTVHVAPDQDDRTGGEERREDEAQRISPVHRELVFRPRSVYVDVDTHDSDCRPIGGKSRRCPLDVVLGRCYTREGRVDIARQREGVEEHAGSTSSSSSSTTTVSSTDGVSAPVARTG